MKGKNYFKKTICLLMGALLLTGTVSPGGMKVEASSSEAKLELRNSVNRIIPEENRFSREEISQTVDILKQSKRSGTEAAKLINAIREQDLYEYALKSVLEEYYDDENKAGLKNLISHIDSRAEKILKNYEEAQKEREKANRLDYRVDRVIIGFEPNTSKSYIKNVASELFGEIETFNESKVDLSNLKSYKKEQIRKVLNQEKDVMSVVDISNGQTVEQAISEYSSYANVKYVEPDYKEEIDAESLTNDTYSNKQYYLKNINVNSGWNAVRDFGFRETFVAVLDTGCQMNHPDLKNMYLKSRSVDVTASGNPKLTTLSKQYTSDHGTEVAGVIAAEANNAKGIAGVGSGADECMTRIMAIKCATEPETLSRSALIRGIYYAVDNGADVINISSGSYSYSEAYEAAIAYAHQADVVVVASAGNDNKSTKHYPSSYKYVISVAATTEADKKASFSNYGNDVDISAPGVSIYTCKTGSAYKAVNGTSFSAPIVSGTISVMRAYNGLLSASQVESIVKKKAKDIGSSKMGSGLIDSGLSIQEAKYLNFKDEKEEIKSVSAPDKKGTLKIKWGGETYSEGFVLYRATSKDGTYEKIKTIKDKYTCSYTDTGLKSGKTYYYKVRGYMKYGSGNKYCKYSNIKSGKSK